jgi:hypothetical protein
MMERWGFKCTCPLCANQDEIALSDKNRLRIEEIYGDLNQVEKRTKKNVDAMAEELLHLIDTEGLHPQVGYFCLVIGHAYLGLGEVERAKRYGEVALDKLLRYAGPDDEAVDDARVFLATVGIVANGVGRQVIHEG